MNIMKKSFLSRQKRLQYRSEKCIKTTSLGRQSVFNGRPFSLQTTAVNDNNSLLTYDSYASVSRTNSSTNRSNISNASEEPTVDTATVSENDDSDESINNDTPSTEFERLMTPFRSIQEIESDTFSFDIFQKKSDPAFNDFANDIFQSSTGTTTSVFDSDIPKKVGYRNEMFDFEDMTNDTAVRTPNNKVFEGFSSYSKSSSCSNSSSRNQTRTSSSKSSKSPRTPGKTTTSDSDAGAYILAVTEGRGQARGEVGIAAMDPRRPHLILCQISDNQRYTHTLTKMNIFSFTEVILPNTFIDGSSLNKLYIDIREHFPSVILTSVQRRHFNETTGLELINQYTSIESGSVMVLLRDKLYAVSAASALLKYIEYTQNVLFVPKSIKMEYQGTEDTMIIDMDTANKLELVTNALKTESAADNTLYGVLKHCHTKGGLRLLRANILQPMCSLSKIESRLNCITELVNKPLLFFAIESAVTSFSNVENLLSLCMHEPQQEGLRAAEYQLKYVLLLKTILEQLPSLITSLEEATSAYFCEVRENLKDQRYGIILDRILESVPENAKSVKGSMTAHLHACFAVKSGKNALLDVAKKTYCEIVQEIWDHVNKLREQYNSQMRMSFSTPRGFHIQYTPGPSDNFNPENNRKHFILIQKSKSTYYFYTPELVALDQRSQQVLNEVKRISNVIFFELLNDIRQHVGCLFSLCEYIAELDVITSFTHVSSGRNYVRPKFGNVMNVTDSRHPILDVIHDGKIVPNDIFAENGRNCMILTGPNQSGKSIYVSQIALLQVMAQVGCYVPASSATFRMTDRLFSRLGIDDSIEANASTLIAEMKDIEYLRQNITSNSLIVIDELCKGTSVDEGTSLAFTICEELLDTNAFIFVTTHYIFLTKLEEMYYNVSNYYFESELVESEGKMSLKFSHKKLPGVTKAEQYGLQIAESTCFPSDVLAKAKEIAQKLLLEKKPYPQVKGLAAKYKIAQELRKELSSVGPEYTWNEIGPTVLRFKTLMLDLGTDNELIDTRIVDATNTHNVGRTVCEFLRNKRKFKKDLLLINTSRNIKRKYRNIMISRSKYQNMKACSLRFFSTNHE